MEHSMAWCLADEMNPTGTIQEKDELYRTIIKLGRAYKDALSVLSKKDVDHILDTIKSIS